MTVPSNATPQPSDPVRARPAPVAMSSDEDECFLAAAIAEARAGQAEGGIPIGAVLVYDGRVIGRGHNRRVQLASPVLHAEIDALAHAGRLPAAVYREATLYTTLSPCAMCSGAILLYGIPRVVVGENRSFVGEEALLRSRGVAVDVRQDATCIGLMADFVAAHPGLWNEDIGVEDGCGCAHGNPAAPGPM